MAALTSKQVRKAAEKKIEDGLGRQQAYDELAAEGTGLGAEELARIVRYVPSLATRAAYKVPHAVLLVLLWITAVGKSLIGLSMAIEQGWAYLPLALLLPAITVWIAADIARYRTRAYHTCAILVVIGLVRFLTHVNWNQFDPWGSIDLIVAITAGGLSWFLFMRVASNFEVEHAPQGLIVRFPPEPIAF